MKKLILIFTLLFIVVKVCGQANLILPEDKENHMYAVKFTNSRFRITRAEDGICSNIVTITAEHYDNSKTVLFTRGDYDFPFNGYCFVDKEIKSLHIYAESIDETDPWVGSYKCDQKATIDKYINIGNNNYCNSYSFTANASSGQGDAQNTITFTYTILPLHHLQFNTNHLPTDDKVTLYDKIFASASLYKYQYRFSDTLNWKDVPSNLYNADKLTLSAKDLFPTNYLTYVEKNILFRVISCTDTMAYSNMVTLTIKLSAPHIENVTYEMPTCHKDDDAKLIIKFDRALYSDNCGTNLPDGSLCNEHVFIFMNGSSSDSIPININPTTFEYTIENLLSGVYNLDLYGVIYHKKNGIIEPVNTYTMGDRHRYTITIPERPALKLESITTDSVHCYGGWDGKINIRMSGGVGKFNAFLRLEDGKPVDTIYNFNSNVTVTFSGLPAGRYTVSVVDTNGCTKDENGVDIISTVEVKQPAAGVEIFNDIQWEEPKCFGGTDGWAQIYFKGGYPPYTVEWRDSANALIPANPVGFDGTRYYSKVENIKSSTYRVTVRDSHYSLATPATEINRCGCYDTISFFVTEPPLLEVSIEERHYVTCYGDSDGVLVAHATGGRKHASGNPYTYEWSKISGGLSFITGTNDSILDNLYSGNYRVKVTDRNLICVAIDTFYLMQPDTLVVDTEVLQNVLCNGENTGSIIAVAKGGTPPYTYLWSNNETTQQIDNLSMGGYVVYVRDARYADNGITGHYCYAQAQAFITSPNGIEFNASVTHPTCNDYSDGSIVLNVTGGVAPYSYIWEDGSAESSRTDLPSGAYTVSVTDFNGCIISQAYRLTNPDPVTVNLGRDITLCKNQTVTIDGNTGIADASYEWTNAAGTALSYMSEYELREAGIYTLTATTVEGCRGSDEIAVSQSDDEIDVDFVIPTTIAGNTKLYAVNITRLSLDDIQWIIPEGAVLFEETEDRIQLLFSRNGNYTVGLTGYKGLCEMTVYKTVTVVDANDITEDESAEPLLKRFIVAPNPNDGNFDAVIELRESVEYRLILYDMNGSTVETTPVYTAVSNIIRFNSSALSAGMYLLKFVSNKTTSIFKVLIH